MQNMSDDNPNNLDCSQFTRNPDMQGFAVRIAHFSTNVCLAILIAYSERDIETAIHSLLLQIYPVLIGTLLCIHRSQITLKDARFAIAVMHSPLALYLVHSAVQDSIKNPNNLFKRLGQTKLIIRFLSFILLTLWIVLGVVVNSSSHAFAGGDCEHERFVDWVTFTPLHMVNLGFEQVGFLNLVLLVFIVWSWTICLIRHRGSLKSEYARFQQRGGPWLRKLALIEIPWIIVCQYHPWIRTLAVVFAYSSWACNIDLYEVDPNYELSYGQILSLAIALPPILSTIKLTIDRRYNILHFIKKSGPSFRSEILFLIGLGPSRDIPSPVIPLSALPGSPPLERTPTSSTNSNLLSEQSPMSSMPRLTESPTQQLTIDSSAPVAIAPNAWESSFPRSESPGPIHHRRPYPPSTMSSSSTSSKSRKTL